MIISKHIPAIIEHEIYYPLWLDVYYYYIAFNLNVARIIQFPNHVINHNTLLDIHNFLNEL